MADIVVINGQRVKLEPHYVVETVPFGYRMTWAEVPAWRAAHPQIVPLVRWRLVSGGINPNVIAFGACFAALGAVLYVAKRKARRAKAAA